MPPHSPSRWLDHLEQKAIIDFIRCNPGRKGREIADYLGYPKRSVNGFLYRYGTTNGVENLDYRWYPRGLVVEPEPWLTTPPQPRTFSAPTPKPEWKDKPEAIEPQVVKVDSVKPPQPRIFSVPTPKPEWTDKPETIEPQVVKVEPVNLAPVNKQSGWSRMGYVYAGLFVMAALLLAKAATGAELVQVKSCYDGDTCTTTTGEKIRLACIDTPEIRGKRAEPIPAKAARNHLRSLVVGQTVGIRRITTDRYGRTVAELFVDGSNVQQAMVASRHAEIYWKYAQ